MSGAILLGCLIFAGILILIAVRATSWYSKAREVVKNYEALFLLLLLIVSFVLGYVGFMTSEKHAGMNSSDAIFNIITMFFMNYTEEVGYSLLLNLSRFSAALFTFGTVFMIIGRVFDSLFNRCIAISKKSALIIGDNDRTQRLMESMRPYGIQGNGKYMPTRGAVFLLGDDDENIRFYSENVERLKDKNVYIHSTDAPGIITPNPNGGKGFVKLFSFEELAAHKYWKKYPLIKKPETLSEAKAVLDTVYHLRVAIIGCGPLVDELLLFGTQYNVYNEESVVEFHIFKGNEEFVKTHTHLDKLDIIYHDEEWYEYDGFDKVDRVIIAEQENQGRIVHELVMLNPQINIHEFSPYSDENSEGIMVSSREDRGGQKKYKFLVYPWISETCQRDVITSDDRIAAAKTLNYMYEYNYSGKGEKLKTFIGVKDEDIEAAWKKCVSYHIYSNLFSTDNAERYDAVCKELFADEHYKIKMRRLEHERWNRYHYFFNWRGATEEEKADIQGTKDWAKRVHVDLVPFDKLPSEEQEKDDIINWLSLYTEYKKSVNK